MDSVETRNPVAKTAPGVHRRLDIPRWDQELRTAKNSGTQVKFQLACDAFFTDDDGIVIGYVLETDKAGFKIKVFSTGVEVWISKLFLLGTEVLFHAA